MAQSLSSFKFPEDLHEKTPYCTVNFYEYKTQANLKAPDFPAVSFSNVSSFLTTAGNIAKDILFDGVELAKAAFSSTAGVNVNGVTR